MAIKDWKHYQDTTKPGKPLKYIYPNQKKVIKDVIAFILPYLKKHPFFKKVWAWGSLSKGLFGVYEAPYREQEGSDVDLLVEVDERFEIPSELQENKEWTKTRNYSRAFGSKLRFVNEADGKSIAHHVDFICHWPSIHSKEGFYKKVKESFLVYEK